MAPKRSARPANFRDHYLSRIIGLLAILAAWPCAVLALDWPQEITADEGMIVVYQPQPERLDGNRLEGRAAMSLELAGQGDPIFGAFWFEATIDTDRDAGTVLIGGGVLAGILSDWAARRWK